VCEVAGKLQGLLPGDLGDIGAATLDASKLNHLRCRILSEKVVLSYANGAFPSNTSASVQAGAAKRSKSTTTCAYSPMTRKERRYFELCSRLLRCSQRTFLAKAEYELAIDSETLGQLTENGLSSDNALLPEEIFQDSPWIEYVINPLCAKNVEPYMKSFSGQDKEDGKRLSPSQSTFTIPTKVAAVSSDPMLVTGYLQLISACAEIFPRGECWSSTNRWARCNFCHFSNHLEGSLGVESFCAVATLQDLARLVRLITSILEHFAGVSGAQTVQAWALICLLKLTESTVIVKRYVNGDTESAADSLGLAWRKTWTVLFRSELRYTSSTTNLSCGSLGELVVMLITEIIHGQCTHLTSVQKNVSKDTTSSEFIYSRQDDVWNLPMYKSVESVSSSLTFELISSLLYAAGLQEGTEDSFCLALYERKDSIGDFSDVSSSRRFRMALFCISVLEVASYKAMDDTLRRLSPYISSCLSALIGEFTFIRTSYRMRCLREFQCSEDSITSNDLIHCRKPSNDLASKIDLTLFWCDVISPFSEQFVTEISADTWRGLHDLDLRLTPSWAAEEREWILQQFNEANVSIPVSSLIHVRKRVKQVYDISFATNDHGIRSIIKRLSTATCKMYSFILFILTRGQRLST